MKALTYIEHGKFALMDKPKPDLLDERDAIVMVTLSSICTPYTYDYEDDPSSRFLPYESYSFNPHGFALRIVDDPSKYSTSPMQCTVSFTIAWAFSDETLWGSQVSTLV